TTPSSHLPTVLLSSCSHLPPPPRSTLFPYTTLFRSSTTTARPRARLPARRRRRRRSGCRASSARRGTRQSRPRALPRGCRLVTPSSSSSLSCGADVELSCHCRCDQRRAALLRQGDVLFCLRDEGVDAGGLMTEMLDNRALLVDRRARQNDRSDIGS